MFSTAVLIIFNLVISAMASVKITTNPDDNKSSFKAGDLKVEEARYRDPVMPEYYGNSYDRNRQNFVTGSNYGSYAGQMNSYDRYGSGMGGYERFGSGVGVDRYGSAVGGDRYGSGIGGDRYGSNPQNAFDKVAAQWNRDKLGGSK